MFHVEQSEYHSTGFLENLLISGDNRIAELYCGGGAYDLGWYAPC